jgi:uncharacterized protein (DUF934 family)
MSKLIKNGQVVSDQWKTITLAAGVLPDQVRLPVGPLLVPVSVWKARRAELIHREYEHGWPLGVWLSAEEGPESIERDIDDFSVVAIKFDHFPDGRSYSTAQFIREEYGFRGELRAIGEVPVDNLHYLKQSGFDAYIAKYAKLTDVSLRDTFDFEEVGLPAGSNALRLVAAVS